MAGNMTLAGNSEFKSWVSQLKKDIRHAQVRRQSRLTQNSSVFIGVWVQTSVKSRNLHLGAMADSKS